MSSQGSDLQEALPVFDPPVKVPHGTAAADRETQKIQSRLGEFRIVKRFLDDPNSSIGVYGEPASPAPCVSQRSVEFKKPHYGSTQNGRPQNRMSSYYDKMHEGNPLHLHHRPAPPQFHNGKTPPSVGEPNGVPPIDHILKEMKVALPPLTAIAATPRKETESKFNFNIAPLQKINDTQSQCNGPDTKPAPPPKHLDRHNNPRLSADLERDLLLTDSEDEVRKRKSSSVMTSPPQEASTSSESSSDTDTDSSSDDSKPNGVCVEEPAAEVVEGPGEAAPMYPVATQQQQRPPSWSLSNFAPQPPANTATAPTSAPSSAASAAALTAAESDSCYDVESVLAAAKSKPATLISDFPTEESSEGEREKDARNRVRSKAPTVGSSSERRGRPPRTPARPLPPSSPSEDEEEPPPRPDQRKPRGRPRKSSKKRHEDVIKRGRGRPPKTKPAPAPPRRVSTSSEDERPPSSPVSHWRSTDSEGEEYTAMPTDKKKNDTLRRLFCPVSGAKGGGKGGAKGGKGKGQVVVIEAAYLDDHEKEDDGLQRRLKEEEAFRKQQEEEMQRKIREEEATRRKQEEEAAAAAAATLARKMEKDALNQRRIKEEEAQQKRLKEEEMRRKMKEEEKRVKEEEAKKVKEERRAREEERRAREEEERARRIKEEEQRKGEDALQRRMREEAVRTRREDAPLGSVVVRVDLGRLSGTCLARLRRGKRPPALPPAPPDKKPKLSVRQNPETTPTNHERSEGDTTRPTPGGQQLVYYSYLERGHQDCSSDEESRDHKYYLLEAKRLRAAAELEGDLLGRVMLYQESVLCFVLTGRVLELELDTKKAFTMYRETMEYIKSIHSMPARHRASPQSTLSKLDILSMRCQALLYLRMFKMYKGEVKEYYKIFQEYVQKPACPEAVGTVSPLSPTPSPAGSVGSVGSGGSSGYGSAAPALTPQQGSGASATSSSSSTTATQQQHQPSPSPLLAVPQTAHQAMVCLTKYYGFLHISHDLWEQADSLIRVHRYTDLFISVDRACGPLTLHSSFRHLVKYVRYAISILKAQSRHGS